MRPAVDRRLVLSFAAAVIFVGAYGAGMATAKYDLPPMRWARSVIDGIRGDASDVYVSSLLEHDMPQPESRPTVNCGDFLEGRAAVILALGQSNAANYGEGRSVAGPHVANFNFENGLCYHARDPLLGASGSGGSVWPILADSLIEAGLFDNVIIAPIAVGASTVAQWAPGGLLHSRLVSAMAAMRNAGLAPTHVVYHQGEADAGRGTSKQDYKASLEAVLRSIREGTTSPILVSVVTRCKEVFSPAIAQAQAEAVASLAAVYPGPNTDEIERFSERHDLCHFSRKGMERFADRLFVSFAQLAEK